MKLIEFTQANGLKGPVMVNLDKVLALYANGPKNEEGIFLFTFIELAPDGVQDATGVIVDMEIHEVAKRLAGNSIS